MDSVLLGLAIITLCYLLVMILEFLIGFKTIRNLTQQPVLPVEILPRVSIIFSALNEEIELPGALQSLLDLDYPHLEIIAVNDRSTDGTARILNDMQRANPSLRVLHIQDLPENWLGKNYALHVASNEATGDWLLFTDADVLMKDSVISKALSYALENELAHLSIYEYHPQKDFWRSVLLLGSYMAYCMEIRPWRVRYAWSKKYLGHGAFNLVNKEAYMACNGHQALAMECLDDMELGRLIKSNGYRQDIVNGRDFVERAWYSSFKEMLNGLQKNSFAHFDFKFSAFIRDFFLALLLFIWPLVGAICFSGAICWLNVGIIILVVLLNLMVAVHYRFPKRYALFYPAAITLLLYLVWNSVMTTYKNKGIIWRGTLYTLESLRNNKMS